VHGRAASLKAIDRKDSVDFALWKPSNQLYYLIGFDKDDTVATRRRVIGLVRTK